MMTDRAALTTLQMLIFTAQLYMLQYTGTGRKEYTVARNVLISSRRMALVNWIP